MHQGLGPKSYKKSVTVLAFVLSLFFSFTSFAKSFEQLENEWAQNLTSINPPVQRFWQETVNHIVRVNTTIQDLLSNPKALEFLVNLGILNPENTKFITPQFINVMSIYPHDRIKTMRNSSLDNFEQMLLDDYNFLYLHELTPELADSSNVIKDLKRKLDLPNEVSQHQLFEYLKTLNKVAKKYPREEESYRLTKSIMNPHVSFFDFLFKYYGQHLPTAELVKITYMHDVEELYVLRWWMKMSPLIPDFQALRQISSAIKLFEIAADWVDIKMNRIGPGLELPGKPPPPYAAANLFQKIASLDKNYPKHHEQEFIYKNAVVLSKLATKIEENIRSAVVVCGRIFN